MKELIKVTEQTIGSEKVNSVDARELWVFLESKQQFGNWIKNRIKEYNFTQDIDFISFNNSIKAENTWVTTKEYTVSLDMAKELSMVEKNAKGKDARKYFIRMEQAAINGRFACIPDFTNPIVSARAWADQVEARQQAESETKKLLAETRANTPKIEGYDLLLNTKGHLTLTGAFKALGLQSNVHIRKLREDGITYLLQKTNMAKAIYIRKGLFDVKVVKRSNTGMATAQTYVTVKGLDWLRDQYVK